ncbi:uncharacterized protein LOC119104953 [Pollicipes pollicipes]|uniref:uncharacterized protein LOC119104953 n=1 Tax=Pollicipes pollicipes TaxID=41117 RepID=UPI001885068C|nr:uncharacterized protein LOC119104953 [Pollicipes pollicipes]
MKPAVAEIKGVIQEWEGLRTAASELQQRADQLSRLQARARSLRHALASLDERTARAGRDVATVDDLQARISAVQALQQELADQRQQLAELNSAVHGHVTRCGGPVSLKEDMATLYRIWEEVSHRAQSQLEHLSAAAATWQEFEAARAELAAALDADRRRLGLLQAALATDSGVTGANVTGADVTGRDVTDRAQATAAVDGGLPADLIGLTSAGLDDLSEGTSGYDSACSDDLSERERRLGRLRRMAGDLEAVLSPGGQAWSDIRHTLTTATSGLRDLQQSCRDLVLQTTSQLQPGDDHAHGSPVLRRKSYALTRRARSPLSPGGRGRRGWLRRVLRVALPVQLAMLLWLCAACLLEPSCCDDLNNLAMSLTPQLRYVGGPPPI